MSVGGIGESQTVLNSSGVNSGNIQSPPSSSNSEIDNVLDLVGEHLIMNAIRHNSSPTPDQNSPIEVIPAWVAAVKAQGGVSTINTNENLGIPEGLENLREVFQNYSITCQLLTDAHKQRLLQEIDVPTPQLDVLATKLTPTILQALSQYFPKATDIKVACQELSLETLKSIFEYFPRLQTLDVSRTELTDDHLQLISYQTQLKTLILSGNDRFTDLGLQLIGCCLTKLERLELCLCHGSIAGGLPSFGNLKELRHLDLQYCAMDSLDSLAALTSLEELIVTNMSSLKNVDVLEKFTHLKKLNIAACIALTHLPSLAGLVQLEWLNVGNSSKISNLGEVVATLTHLKYLDMTACKLRSIDFLYALTDLEELQLTYCDQIVDIDVLTRLSSLQNLWLMGCAGIESIKPLTALTNLKILRLIGCTRIHDVGLLAQLRELQLVYLPDEEENPEITIEVVNALKQALPACTISYNSLAEHQERKEEKNEKTNVEEEGPVTKKRKVMLPSETEQENEDYPFVEQKPADEELLDLRE